MERASKCSVFAASRVKKEDCKLPAASYSSELDPILLAVQDSCKKTGPIMLYHQQP